MAFARLHSVRSCLEQPFQLFYVPAARFQAILRSHDCLSDQKLCVAFFVCIHLVGNSGSKQFC